MDGCCEHTSMVWAALKDACSKRRSLLIIWLDLADAYGSVPHMLILVALRRYRIPEDWITLVIKYYNGLSERTSGSTLACHWYQYEKGIFAGCTILVILFLAAFNLIWEYVGQAGLPRNSLSTIKSMPVFRAFMDNVRLMTISTPASKIALQRTLVALIWVRMKLTPPKSRSLVIKGGKCIDQQPFQVAGEIIQSIQKEPLKTLGRVYNSSVTDKADTCRFEEEEDQGAGTKNQQVFVNRNNEGMGVSEFCYLQ